LTGYSKGSPSLVQFVVWSDWNRFAISSGVESSIEAVEEDEAGRVPAGDGRQHGADERHPEVVCVITGRNNTVLKEDTIIEQQNKD
jgi:hypothetical protein